MISTPCIIIVLGLYTSVLNFCLIYVFITVCYLLQSFNLRRNEGSENVPSIPRPGANINVAAILEKANAIRQVLLHSVRGLSRACLFSIFCIVMRIRSLVFRIVMRISSNTLMLPTHFHACAWDGLCLGSAFWLVSSSLRIFNRHLANLPMYENIHIWGRDFMPDYSDLNHMVEFLGYYDLIASVPNFLVTPICL